MNNDKVGKVGTSPTDHDDNYVSGVGCGSAATPAASISQASNTKTLHNSKRMPDDSIDRRERRRRRSRSSSSGSDDPRLRRSEDYERAQKTSVERDRQKHDNGKYSRRRDERPRRRSYSPDPADRKHRRSHSPDRDATERRRRRSSRDHPSRPHKTPLISPRRSRSPPRHPKHSRSRSPTSHTNKRPRSPSPRTNKRARGPLPSQQAAFNGTPNAPPGPTTTPPAPADKQKPNYAPTGKLAAETNTVAHTSIVLKYHEPPEARKPAASAAWRLYVFKGASTLATVELATRSCWLFGRESSVVDFPIEHPSCSKQHAVLQFRHGERKNEDGDVEAAVRPYVIDLESANGTRVNGGRVPERRFVEVRSGDVLGFGESTREYVVLLPPKG